MTTDWTSKSMIDKDNDVLMTWQIISNQISPFPSIGDVSW